MWIWGGKGWFVGLLPKSVQYRDLLPLYDVASEVAQFQRSAQTTDGRRRASLERCPNARRRVESGWYHGMERTGRPVVRPRLGRRPVGWLDRHPGVQDRLVG